MGDVEARSSAAETVEEAAWLRVMELSTLSCLPMAIKAAINLDIMNILADVEEGTYLSAPQIVGLMKLDAKPSPSSIDRLLRLLASHGILSSSTTTSTSLHSPSLITSCPPLTTSYSLNAISKYFVSPHDSSPSLSPFSLMHQDKIFIQSLFYIDEAILDGGEPFVKAHGKSSFVYNEVDARFDKVFNLSMHNHSRLLISSLVEVYNGFDGLHSLVDVGGGLGVTMSTITSKHPHIQGINFDLPHIIAKAPPYVGVEHVAGDMFVSIPKAQAIFMKWILHDWSDEHCLKILENCFEALPNNGKVIVVDAVLPTQADSRLKTRVCYQLDVLMFAYNTGGRERNFHELKTLATSVGFSHLEVICEIQESTVVEIYKS